MGLFHRDGVDEKAEFRATVNEENDVKRASANYTDAAGPSSFNSTIASLSLHMTDRIRLLQFPPQIQTLIHDTIRQNWERGIQDIRDYHGSHEIKIKGTPWRGYSDEAIFARQLMQKLLENLFNAGWIMALNTDISKKQLDLDTLIFRYQDPAPQPCQWMTIAFSRTDRLRFLSAPQEVVGDMLNVLGPSIQSHAAHSKVASVYDIKIKGYPWAATGGETVRARMMILKMLETLERHGFTVYASIDQKTGAGGDSHQTETDTW